MSEVESAAQVDDETLDSGLYQPEVISEESTQSVESAPTNEKTEDGFQSRINRATTKIYAEKRRGDDLQRQLDELKAKPAEVGKAPTLEDHDFDDALFNAASIKHQVDVAIQDRDKEQRQDAINATAEQVRGTFNDRIVAINKPDFDDVANAVPVLPDGVADALMQSENGPDLIYHLGTHLDIADKISNMSPGQAMMELGVISASMNSKPDIKVSAAPDPIEPLSSGGAISSKRGPTGATFT